MANDGGLIAKLEQYFADALAALSNNGEPVFRKADIWRHQIAATAGGMEAFTNFSPFAFVSFQSESANREGDYDLRQSLEFAVLIGVESKEDGVCRFGDATHLGVSKIRDLVIALFDKSHPSEAEAIACDEIYYTGTIEILDSPKRYAIQMTFETSYLNTA